MPPSATHSPKYVALSYDGETIAADDSLAVVLAQLRTDFDGADSEELVIWKDAQTVAAVMREDGSFTMFEPVELPPASKPPARPGNGRGRGRRP